MQKYLMPSNLARAAFHPIVLCAAAFIAILPMLLGGASCGHDFSFHLINWQEAASQFTHFGYPHWAFTPGWGAGEPRFIFYPPLSWSLGAVLGLILPWKFVPIAFTWIALALSGLTMHRVASRFTSPNAALLAATLYLANPYMLFTAYERTAYGELLAAAWMPLLFAAALATRARIVPIAIALALIWLTNAPAGVMASYSLALITLIRLCTPSLASRLRLATTVATGTILAFALAAFYLAPAIYEQRFVQIKMAIVLGVRPIDNFLFHKMPANDYHNDVVRSASIVALTLLAGIAVALFFARSHEKTCHPSRGGGPAFEPLPLLPLVLLTLLVAFLLTPLSLVFWDHVPKLAFLQFPWRLCAILSVILALTAAVALKEKLSTLPSSRSGSPANAFGSLGWLFALPCLCLTAALVLPTWHSYRQACDANSSVAALVTVFHSNVGVDPTDEYTPIGADGDAIKQDSPPYWLIPSGTNINSQPPANAVPGPAPNHLNLDLPAPETLVLNRRQYPLWQIRDNGKVIAPAVPERLDGLIAIPLPAGPATIDLAWTPIPYETTGLVISNLAWITCVFIYRRRDSLQQ